MVPGARQGGGPCRGSELSVLSPGEQAGGPVQLCQALPGGADQRQQVPGKCQPTPLLPPALLPGPQQPPMVPHPMVPGLLQHPYAACTMQRSCSPPCAVAPCPRCFAAAGRGHFPMSRGIPGPRRCMLWHGREGSAGGDRETVRDPTARGQAALGAGTCAGALLWLPALPNRPPPSPHLALTPLSPAVWGVPAAADGADPA